MIKDLASVEMKEASSAGNLYLSKKWGSNTTKPNGVHSHVNNSTE